MLFQQVTGTRFQFIPYRGTAPVIPDLVSGQIDMAILDPITSLPQFRAGKIKILAVMGKKRGTGSQDIPTGDEAGAPGVYTEPWQGMWAPKGTPKDVIAKLNGAVVSALSDPAIRKKFADQSYELTPREQLTPEYLAAIPQGRDGQVVPDHQGGGHQGRLRWRSAHNQLDRHCRLAVRRRRCIGVGGGCATMHPCGSCVRWTAFSACRTNQDSCDKAADYPSRTS